MYKVLDSYQRFDQKNNMLCRSFWDPTVSHLALTERYKTQLRLMESGADGFALKDFALSAGAQLIVTSFGTGILTPNAGFTSWEPLPLSWSYKFPDEKPPVTDAGRMAREIKRVARYMGADVVGITKLDMRWVYTNHYIIKTGESKPVEIDEGYKYVIVMGLEMDYNMIRTAPSALQFTECNLVYSRMAGLVGSLAQFIRLLGYRAIPSLNDTALNVPIAIDAGLGEVGRHGLLISPWFGPRQRLCKVITDIPLQTDEPIEFGVREFCTVCKKCARECPSQAIASGEPTTEAACACNNPGVLKWPLTAEKCFGYWTKVGTDCGICLRACPFNKPKGQLHDMVRWFIKHAPAVNRTVLRFDDWLGYGKYLSPAHFWNG